MRRWFPWAGGTLLLLLLVVGGTLYRNAMDTPLAVSGEGAELIVHTGTPLSAITRQLTKRGILAHPHWINFYARMHGSAGEIKAGEYLLEPGTTPVSLIDKLTTGKIRYRSITIVDGWTFTQLRSVLDADPYLDHQTKGLDDSTLMQRLGHPGEYPEGMFLPETYHFPRGSSDIEFLRRAYAAMQRLLDTEWSEREDGLPLKTPYQALILASIVEKESAQPQERPEIAGVFIRRLQRGMRLQTDPTVIYGLGPKFDGNLRLRDLHHDTPYNTYTRKGLPPTPIALPGAGSLHAALHPTHGDALYFVSKGDGYHQFSATLEEHNRAVIRYQLKGRARSFSSDPKGRR